MEEEKTPNDTINTLSGIEGIILPQEADYARMSIISIPSG